ncbi:autophagy protein Apg17-domain-containing protein [Xylogone sp. PMI_703]|nr:autophagy protein Apg17-domain-containing protein [Xylogone sp. PMI_703]
MTNRSSFPRIFTSNTSIPFIHDTIYLTARNSSILHSYCSCPACVIIAHVLAAQTMSTSPSPLHQSQNQAALSPGSSPHSHHQQIQPSDQQHDEQSIAHEEISLERLVQHLLASKRSLSSISTVWRANEIVTSARAALEKSVKLTARSGYLRACITDQAKTLSKVRGGVEGVYNEGQKDFKNVLRTLDAANARLEETMGVLRSCMVEAAFRPAGEGPRSLLDFVDEQPVENMRDALRASINEAQQNQVEFDTAILSFDTDLRNLRSSLPAAPSTANTTTNVQSSSLSENPIPEHLEILEKHAQEMAALLDSLSSHFDLCVNAIRHTEGGYAAVRQAASAQPPGVEAVSVSGVMQSPGEEGMQPEEHETITEDERREMLQVLETDAGEVEDVVLELRTLLAEMETLHDAILSHLSSQHTSYTSTLTAFTLLESISTRLTSYIISAQDFRVRWEETRLSILDKLEELESMRVFYEKYAEAYDGLIIEVARRHAAEVKVKTVIDRALEQVQRIVESDAVEREGFRVDVGEYLPLDLWDGLSSGMKRWGIAAVEEPDGGGVGKSTPELEKAVVEKALKRDRERRGAAR